MGCFPCLSSCRKDWDFDDDTTIQSAESSVSGRRKSCGSIVEYKDQVSPLICKGKECGSRKENVALSFTFRELATATRNFNEVNLIGEGGFGKVFKGQLEPGQIVAIKKLNLNGLQGNQEFIMEVLMLSLLHHPNLVTLIGYCTDGDQRLLVYEYMAMGSLEGHLYDIEADREPLDWSTRIKIAIGAARALEYLHCKAKPPVIYRDIKSANILLDKDFNPKLSDFGLAKLGPVGDNTHVSTRIVGTYGYCAPEYAISGKLTVKSDIYSFGVVLLELITGRKVIDPTRKPGEQNLVVWSCPFLKDRRKFIQLVDPLLEGQFPIRSLHHVVAISAMCLQEEANFRPFIGDIVVALEYLASQTNEESQRGMACSTPSASPLQQDSESFCRKEAFGGSSST